MHGLSRMVNQVFVVWCLVVPIAIWRGDVLPLLAQALHFQMWWFFY